MSKVHFDRGAQRGACFIRGTENSPKTDDPSKVTCSKCRLTIPYRQQWRRTTATPTNTNHKEK